MTEHVCTPDKYGYRYRTVHCTVHAHGQFAIEACPLCRENIVAARHCDRNKTEVLRREEIDAAVLKAIAVDPPTTYSDLAARVRTMPGFERTRAPTMAVSLRRLRELGQTTLVIEPQGYVPRKRS